MHFQRACLQRVSPNENGVSFGKVTFVAHTIPKLDLDRYASTITGEKLFALKLGIPRAMAVDRYTQG